MEFSIILLFSFKIITTLAESSDYSVIKEIDGIIYVGGKNSLSSYTIVRNNLVLQATETYQWPPGIINGSSIGSILPVGRWPNSLTFNPSSIAFDTCLNWKQEHPNPSNRNISFDYHHWNYHTPSGDFKTMNFTCMNSFIKGIEIIDSDKLWVCATFGAFPRAFSVNKTNLRFIEFVDVNMMSCARYVDEPMVTYKDNLGNLYVGSGWGLYRPDKASPDVPDNNSTMLYADWRLYRNLFTLPATMAWVLSSDVNFIKVVKETKSHLYFFGYEINNQYGLNNQEDRNAWQSFLLRICKNDVGFKYIPAHLGNILKYMVNLKYYAGRVAEGDYQLSPLQHEISFNDSWYHDTIHLPTTHFVNSQKINFGCYIGKRPRAISDNYFWGETNVVYLSKLTDVIFDPNRKIKFKTKNNNQYFGCRNESHSQLPLIGIFNNPGIQGTATKPVGALCQLQINENIFYEEGSKKSPYHTHNILNMDTAFEEIMSISSTSYSNFYSRTLHRTNGFTLYPYWNQGVLIRNSRSKSYYQAIFNKIGKCCNNGVNCPEMTSEDFLSIQNFSNTAWPNELPNRLSSIPSAICQFSAVELYSFNATFVVPGDEFKRIFLLKENYTNYFMHRLAGETDRDRLSRRRTSPLMIVLIITNSGILYRVTLCDFDNSMANHGEDKTGGEWYNWCIFRHTDQPYLYRQYAPMERREWEEPYQYRASSLLYEKNIVNKKFSINSASYRDPQFHNVKDVLKKGNYLHVLTTSNIYRVDLHINCGTYSKCIECASDPICMWHIKENKCILYNENNFDLSVYMQDVLDRGFKCVFRKNPDIRVSVETNSVMILRCFNSDFWRGNVVWKLNGKDFSEENNDNVIVDKKRNLLTLFNYSVNELNSNFSCFGAKDDYDKLFNGLEYDLFMDASEILLNEFVLGSTIISVQDYCIWKPIGIIFILSTCMMTIFAFRNFIFRKIMSLRDQINLYFQNKENIRRNKVKDEINGLISRNRQTSPVHLSADRDTPNNVYTEKEDNDQLDSGYNSFKISIIKPGKIKSPRNYGVNMSTSKLIRKPSQSTKSQSPPWVPPPGKTTKLSKTGCRIKAVKRMVGYWLPRHFSHSMTGGLGVYEASYRLPSSKNKLTVEWRSVVSKRVMPSISVSKFKNTSNKS